MSQSEEEPSALTYVRREMGDTYSLDSKLLERLFPIEAKSIPNHQKARGQWFNERHNRWKGISAKPTPLSRIYRPLTNLLNGILFHYGIKRDRRLFIDTHNRRQDKVKSKDSMPGVWLSGVGAEFANAADRLPRDMFNICISAIEVVLDSDDMMAARDRLAVHMHWIFQCQDNRRFAFGLIMTPNVFTLYMFDHSGAVASEPCNYHLHPERFCALISGLAANGERIGFDHTMFREYPLTKICCFRATGEATTETEYIVERCLFEFPSLVGRGTMCWLTSRADDPHSLFVIKDSWVAPGDLPGKESEESLLRHAQSCGISTGIGKIHHFEEVRRSQDPFDLDTVLRNRKIEGNSPDVLKLERVHTRLIMSSYGKTLDRFSTRKELLFAFHDAVLAHRKLHDIAGILHRDISYGNILINPNGVEGDRGILIDFDHSIRVGDTSPYSAKPGIGTWRFRSREVLKKHVPHTYFDDLESFYYVLCWIICAFESAGVMKEKLPNLLDFWDRPTSYELKTGWLLGRFNLPISSYFGTSLPALACRLHDYFGFRLIDPPTSQDPDKDYEEFISHIQRAIVDLENEERENAPEVLAPPKNNNKSAGRKRKRDKPEEHGNVSASAHSSEKKTVPYGRPRRTTANYGYPP